MKQSIIFLTLLFSLSLMAADKSKTVTLNVNGMTCESCASTVEKALKKVNGVEAVKVNLNEKKATVTLASNSKTTTSLLMKAVDNAGFKATEGKAPSKSGMKMKSGDEECGDGCCGDECDTEAKPAKGKKAEVKKS